MNYEEELYKTNILIEQLKNYPIKDNQGFYTKNYQQLKKLERIRRTLLTYMTREQLAQTKKIEIHHIKK